MDQMQSQSSVPLLLSYRGIGSGGGQTEFKGSFSATSSSYVPFNDFGSGDVPMPNATWTTLTANGLPFVQIPIMVRILSTSSFPPIFPAPRMELSRSSQSRGLDVEGGISPLGPL